MRMRLSSTDKTIGLIVTSIAMFCLSLVFIARFVFDIGYTDTASIMVVSWWFGATMTWLGEKHYNAYKNRQR